MSSAPTPRRSDHFDWNNRLSECRKDNYLSQVERVPTDTRKKDPSGRQGLIPVDGWTVDEEGADQEDPRLPGL